MINVKQKLFLFILCSLLLVCTFSVYLSADKNKGTSKFLIEDVSKRNYNYNRTKAYKFVDNYSILYKDDYVDEDLGVTEAFVLNLDLRNPDEISYTSKFDEVYFNNTTKKRSTPIETEMVETESEFYLKETEIENIFDETESESFSNETEFSENLLIEDSQQLLGSETTDISVINFLFGGELDNAIIKELNEKTYKEGENYISESISSFVRRQGNVYYFYYLKGDFIVYEISLDIKEGEILIDKTNLTSKDVFNKLYDFINIPVEEEFPVFKETEEEFIISETDDEYYIDEPLIPYYDLVLLEDFIGEENIESINELLVNAGFGEAVYYTYNAINDTKWNFYILTDKGYLLLTYNPMDESFILHTDNIMNTANFYKSMREDIEESIYKGN